MKGMYNRGSFLTVVEIEKSLRFDREMLVAEEAHGTPEFEDWLTATR
jgi:hypothetical protein